MTSHILTAAAGVGLFLIGMLIMTEGLRGLAGDSLRRFLRQFTRSPTSGAAAGALTTALIQSSSATIVAAVGFVAAGLLTFPQALGIIFGANIGTTLTGWLVAIIGFKLKLGEAVLPVILIGVLLRLFTTGRWQQAGWALAGFGLLFVGIDTMKSGMAHFQGVVTPDLFPDASVIGILKLVAVGAAITIVTQSSSAGVAAALVALSAGSITFPQAAAMVIGMDIGTTATAALATLGGSAATRQTGYAHVIYNLMTGVMALLLLIPILWGVEVWRAHGGTFDAQIALVAFHSFFNGLGVILILPFTVLFARLIKRLVSSRDTVLTTRLDDRLLDDPGSAVSAVAATLRDLLRELAGLTFEQFQPTSPAGQGLARLAAVREGLDATQTYAERIRTEASSEPIHTRHVSSLHALDHLMRLAHRCGQTNRVATIRASARFGRLSRLLWREAGKLRSAPMTPHVARRFDRIRSTMRDARRTIRAELVETAAATGQSGDVTIDQLDAVRWLHRTSYHYWRITHHLNIAMQDAPAPAAQLEPAPPSEARLDVETD